MKTQTLTGLIACCIFLLVLPLSAQTAGQKQQSDAPAIAYKPFGMNEFPQMDMELIACFPTQSDWQEIGRKIRTVPPQKLRWIDTLDVRYQADTMFVTVCSQNYAYQSRNTYKIGRKSAHPNDTLPLYHFSFDMKMKEVTQDVSAYRLGAFHLTFTQKVDARTGAKKVIFHKIFR